jgi:general stress protein 26
MNKRRTVMTLKIPGEIETVFRQFRTCEFSTLSKDGTPITWPVTPLYEPEKNRFVITTSIGLPQKAFHIRHNSKVSLFFSDPTGSGLENPPFVLVQGDAEAPDQIVTWSEELEKFCRHIFKRQPAGKANSSNGLMRYLLDWYYMRLFLYVTPKRILKWSNEDFKEKPYLLEV